jgi:SAM-dependent methyltransferase
MTTRVSVQRTHDRAIYLGEDRYEAPKEFFKVLVERALASGAAKPGSVIGEFGCAAGELLYHFRSRLPEATYLGYDVVPEFIEKAKRRVSGVTFGVGDVLDRALRPAASLDVAILFGVHSIFDDVVPCFSNLLHWTRPGGCIYVGGLFNPHPVDVWVYYRHAEHPDPHHREPGWNLVSKATVSRYLDATLGSGRHTFMPFEMPFDLAPNSHDPIRTWTIRDQDGRRRLTNGLSLLAHLEILEIRP